MRQQYEAAARYFACERDVKLCDCMHDSTEHRKRVGPCRGRGGYGCRCECPSFLENHDYHDHDEDDEDD